jgi:hypothetical protein
MTLRTGKNGRYRYSACAIRARQGDTGCKGRAIPMDKLDKMVVSHIEEGLLDPERIEDMLASHVEILTACLGKVQKAARTDAARFLSALATGRQRLQIRAHHRRDGATIGLPGDLAGCGLALSKRLLEPFDGHGQPNRASVAEAVGNCLGWAEHLDWNTLDHMRLDTVGQELSREPHDPDRCAVRLGAPVPLADGDPNPSRELIGQAVEGES